MRRNLFGPVLVAAAFLALLSSSAFAQVSTGKLTGVVTDQATGEPLSGVSVFLEGTGRGALTAENGRYFIVNVPPGEYTVVAQLIGYQTVRRQGVVVNIDLTKVASFELVPQAVAVEEIRVEAEQARLVRLDATGTLTTTTAAEIAALPVTSLEEALSLQQGFLEVPQNWNILAFTETRRGISPIRIRGGRQGETLTLIDGIPVNNFVFGGPALSITPKALEQVDFIKGGFEPQYGNALSGIVNIVTREGGTELVGAVEYQTSEIAGALGSRPDDLAGFDLVEGFVSGPIPGTTFGSDLPRLRFMVATRQQNSAHRVLEFDDDVFDPAVRRQPSPSFLTPAEWDLFPGWRAMGYDQQRDILGKLTLELNPTAHLRFSIIDYERQQQPFDFDFLRAVDNLKSPIIDTQADTLFVLGRTEFTNRDIVEGSARLDRTILIGSFNQILSRTTYNIAVARFDQSRSTCNFFLGVCLRTAFDDANFDENRFIRSGVGNAGPARATDIFFGGEDLRTYVARFDIQSQVTDHHNFQAGVYYEDHDLVFDETQNLGINDVVAVSQVYKGTPWNAAAYIQDKIEYDFIRVNLGFRFDVGKAGGLFFADPLDPTNGTNALDVCSNPEDFGLSGPDADFFRGNCGEIAIRDSAARIAFQDDLEETSTRTQMSPRIGVSFPVTASSSFFFNFGRYSQNPLFNPVYQNTSIGTPGEGRPCGFAPPGSDLRAQCGPIIFSNNYGVAFLGNPNLLIEQTTAYELGFLAELFDDYGLSVILFNKDQSGLTGIRTGGVGIHDPGATYGTSTPQYLVLVNTDFQTARGIEISLRRRLTNFWGFDLNYGYMQLRTNAAPPDREFQNRNNDDFVEVRREFVADIDQPHQLNAAFRFQAHEEHPEIRIGGTDIGSILKHSALAVTVQAESGFPYTPVGGFSEEENFRSRSTVRNTARGPATWSVDLRAEKNFKIGNVLHGAFVRIENLFDTKNCIQVFETTGRCDAGTIDQNRSLQGNSSSADAVNSTFFDRPHFFGPRRTINVGFRSSF